MLSLLLDFATFVLIEKTVKEAAKIIEVIIMLINLFRRLVPSWLL